jgi:predicted acetyltransferase
VVELTAPDVALHDSWLAAAAEFTALGEYQHGSGLTPDGDAPRPGLPAWRPAELADLGHFAAFLQWLATLEHRHVTAPLALVPDTKLWITRAAPAEPISTGSAQTREFVGSVSLRHELNAFLFEEGGHIGYSVRPSKRRQGIATRALDLTLDVARGIGLDQVLVTCDDDNAASARTIEACGGELEDVRNGKRRYWIVLPAVA